MKFIPERRGSKRAHSVSVQEIQERIDQLRDGHKVTRHVLDDAGWTVQLEEKLFKKSPAFLFVPAMGGMRGETDKRDPNPTGRSIKGEA